MAGKRRKDRGPRQPKWSFEHTVETTATPEAVWRVWAAFDTRSEWDEVHRARLDGPFVAGATGEWHPAITKRFPPQPVWLEEVVPNRRFVLGASHQKRLAELHYHHELGESEQGATRVTHRLEVTGPLGGLIGRFAGARMATAMPAAMTRLVDEAQRRG